jgi:signal transduction histidine kinase
MMIMMQNAAAPQSADNSSARILVVEDEAIVALDIQNRLRRLGYQVIGHATAGEEAIELADIYRPNLVLMDIHLRDAMDGIEAAEEIRDRFDIPVIYLTAYTDSGTLNRAKITEPYGYLTKPFNERELHSNIEMSLYKHAAEQQMRRQSQLLQRIIDTMPQGITLLDANLRVVSANARARDALEILANRRVGDVLTTLGEVSVPDTLCQTPAGVWHQVIVDKPAFMVFELTAAPLALEQASGSTGWIILMRDATWEYEAQQRIQQQGHLAAIGQLAAGIAHDFNNMLAVLSLSVQLVLQTQPDLLPDNQERLRTCSDQVNRGAEMIRQILDFSRKSTMEARELNLVPFIKEVSKLIRRLLPENITFDFQHDPDPCPAIVDPTRVQQVLMNLVVNARDAMPNGGRLTVRLGNFVLPAGHVPPYPGMDRKQWVQMKVSDTGHGMAPETIAHIFEPFFTTKRPDRGTGLGLAQVYGIVQQHGGFIDVQSTLGVGTSFTVYWPAPSVETQAQKAAAESADMDTVLGKGQTILVVEDNNVLRQNLVEILCLLDYRVLDAANGFQAVELLNRSASEIDLVITDMIMPGLNGIEVCRHVKQIREDLDVILLTGYAAETSYNETELAGFSKILRKPISVTVLSQEMSQIFSRTPIDTQWLTGSKACLEIPSLNRPPEEVEQETLHLYIMDNPVPITHRGGGVILLGRKPTANSEQGEFEVDLSPYSVCARGVSKRHAQIRYGAEGYFVRDLNSRNGTLLNGHPLRPEQDYTLRSGDQIQIGDVALFPFFLESLTAQDRQTPG